LISAVRAADTRAVSLLRSLFLGLLVAACAPARSEAPVPKAAVPIATGALPTSSGAQPEPPAVPDDGNPRWPAPKKAPLPPGFEARTVRHETIHADIAVPRGTSVTLTRDAYNYPRVDISVDGEVVFLQFDSGPGTLAATLAGKPPTVGGKLAAERFTLTPDGIAARYRDVYGDLRLYGHAPGVKCVFEPRRKIPEPTLERIFTVCSSLRSAAPGRWRPATDAERAHGGMTDVPEGAFVEGALPDTPGALLRTGPFVAALYAGAFKITGRDCPASYEYLGEWSAPEVAVTLEKRTGKAGDAWVRSATESYAGHDYPGATTVIAPRDGRCCVANLIPWTAPPSSAQLDYVVALCDTFRAK
jgi:hypothetical protein